MLAMVACSSGADRPAERRSRDAAPRDALQDAPIALAPPSEVPSSTVIMLDHGDRAIVLGCFVVEKNVLSDDADLCRRQVIRDRSAMPLGGGLTRTLASDTVAECAPDPGDPPRHRRRAIGLDTVVERAPSDADEFASEFLVWPTSHAARFTVWNTRAQPDLSPVVAHVISASKKLAAPDGVGFELVAPPKLLGTLEAELDGDHRRDVVYSIALPSDYPFFKPHYLVAQLGARPETVIELKNTRLEALRAVAAKDLDGDGKDELLITSDYHEGDGAMIATFERGKLVPRGQWFCGL